MVGAKRQPNIIVDSEEEAIAIVSECGDKLRRLDAKWRNNKKVVIAAIQSSGFAFEFASTELKDDAQVVYLAVRKQPRMLMEASRRWRENKALRETAFELNGSPFIVDPKAFAEFEYIDKQIVGRYKSEVLDDGTFTNAEEVERMCRDSMYIKLRTFYSGEIKTAEEIDELEQWLLKHYEERITRPQLYYKRNSMSL